MNRTEQLAKLTASSPKNLIDPCGHARPQADSQLHGVCIFCWRDRASAAVRERALLLRYVAELEQEIDREYHGFVAEKTLDSAWQRAVEGK